MKLSRRTILHSATAIAGFGLLSSKQSQTQLTSFIDLENPEDKVIAFAKLAGSLKPEAVHYFYSGTIYGMTPDESDAFRGTCETPALVFLERKHWAEYFLNQCFRGIFRALLGAQDRPWGRLAFCIRN